MIRIAIITIAIIILFSQTFAQEDTTSRKNSLYPGAWALQFQVSGLINNIYISDFQGAGISIKKHLTCQSALRLGFSLGTNISTYNDDYFTNDSVYPTQSRDENTFNLSIRTQYLNYLTNASRLNIYIGFGPQITYVWSKRENDYLGINSTKSNSIAFGLNGVAGAELFLSNYISVHAEYGSTLEYSWWKYTHIANDNVHETTKKSFIINPSSVKLGLSLYF